MNTNLVQSNAVMFLRANLIVCRDDPANVERAIRRQRQMCEDVAQRLNVRLVREYVERGGAGSIDKRTELRLMLDELRALHDVKYVIVADVDRLTRKMADMEQILFEIDAVGAQVVYLDHLSKKDEVVAA